MQNKFAMKTVDFKIDSRSIAAPSLSGGILLYKNFQQEIDARKIPRPCGHHRSFKIKMSFWRNRFNDYNVYSSFGRSSSSCRKSPMGFDRHRNNRTRSTAAVRHAWMALPITKKDFDGILSGPKNFRAPNCAFIGLQSTETAATNNARGCNTSSEGTMPFWRKRHTSQFYHQFPPELDRIYQPSSST